MDGIPNIVLKRCVDIITPILLTCLHAIIRLQYFPSAWREWMTIVLHKPGWDDYTISRCSGNNTRHAGHPAIPNGFNQQHTALKEHRKTMLIDRWKQIWVVSPHYPRITEIDSSIPSWCTYKMLAALPQ
jgi:hypothetical protein